MSVPQLIEITPGSLCAQVPGEIHANDPVSFTVQAESGQFMVLNGRPITDGFAINGIVIFPSGRQDGGIGDGVFFNQTLTETGIYTIQISARHMISPLNNGSFILEVIIMPSWLINQLTS